MLRTLWRRVNADWRFARERPRTSGDRGEALAARHLRRCGHRILHRQWQGHTGEIDIVSEHTQRSGSTVRRCLVITEVKTRTGSDAAIDDALLAVDARKQRRIARVAAEWLQTNRYASARLRLGWSVRFDVVAVGLGPDGTVELRHLSDAFESPI